MAMKPDLDSLSDAEFLLHLYGLTCTGYTNCEDCPLNETRGDGTCPEMLRDNPEKVIKELLAISGEGSYYNEFCRRFPFAQLSLEEVAKTSCCRVMFSGNIDCHKYDDPDACMKCWASKYEGDTAAGEHFTDGLEGSDGESGSGSDDLSDLF